MAENESNKSLDHTSKKNPAIRLSKNGDNKSADYFSIHYHIDKISGLRTGKRSNSFKAPLGTNVKAMIQTILRKIRFSTRYKYAILYFNNLTNSKVYLEWQKLKDGLDYSKQNSLKIRVCRYKVKPKTENIDLNPNPIINSTQISPESMENSIPLSPVFLGMFFSYWNYVQCLRTQGFNNMMP